MDQRQYARGHRDPVNLIVHLFAVPLFLAAAATIAFSAWQRDINLLAVGLIGLGVSLAFQAIGHAREKVAPLPFRNPLDFAGRVLAEQFYRFPVFLLSGKWWDNLRDS